MTLPPGTWIEFPGSREGEKQECISSLIIQSVNLFG